MIYQKILNDTKQNIAVIFGVVEAAGFQSWSLRPNDRFSKEERFFVLLAIYGLRSGFASAEPLF